jgi:hypothetical protein
MLSGYTLVVQSYHEQLQEQVAALRALVGTCTTALDRGDVEYAHGMLKAAYEAQERAWDDLKASLDAVVDAELPETTDARPEYLKQQREAWLQEAPDAEECPGCADFGEVLDRETESWVACPECRAHEVRMMEDGPIGLLEPRHWSPDHEMLTARLGR